jgi:hypothetical protein
MTTDPHWHRRRVAEHEATHAIVALKMGLPVEWVTIEDGYDEGINFVAAVKIPDEKLDMERDRLAICVAMAAPSLLDTHRSDKELFRYAKMEASLAYEIAGRHGITFDEVYDLCVNMVDDHWVEIADLTDRLMAEGTVTLALA